VDFITKLSSQATDQVGDREFTFRLEGDKLVDMEADLKWIVTHGRAAIDL
jgi:hypothetical protein